jgi:MSHA biogenesis protein MshG
MLLVLGGGTALAMYLLHFPQVRLQFDRFKFHMKLIGPIYTKILISRFARIFSMLVHNGIPVLRGLEVSAEVVANTYFKHQLLSVKQHIQDGGTIADAFFTEMRVFPPMVTNLIAIGEKTGSLDSMLDQVVEFYDMEIKYVLRNLTTMIEPIITVVIAIGVLFLALAILMPIWDMSSVLTTQAQQ